MALASTVTDSLTAPIVRAKLNTRLSEACTTTPTCSEALNPACATRILKVPRGTSGKLYTPSLPVLPEREKPVDGSLIVTSAPGTAAPCSSVTVPRTEPFTFWPSAAGTLELNKTTKHKTTTDANTERHIEATTLCIPPAVFALQF